jgi:hypothetical protein
MAIEVATENEERNLVESFRATSYDGREPWIPALDPAMGTPVVAVRQLEACAAHPACAWRDEVMDELGRWAFMRGCLLKPILAVAQIVEGSVPSATLRGDANGDNYLVLAWRNFYGDFVQRRPGRRCASARSATLRRRMVENDGSICHTLITPKPRGL